MFSALIGGARCAHRVIARWGWAAVPGRLCRGTTATQAAAESVAPRVTDSVTWHSNDERDGFR